MSRPPARYVVQGAQPDPDPDRARQREVVDAFRAASRSGDVKALLAMLDSDVVLRADAATVAQGATAETRGARSVAETFAGRARAAKSALVDGAPGAVWMVHGKPRVVFRFTVTGGTISGIDLIADPATVDQLDVEIVG